MRNQPVFFLYLPLFSPIILSGEGPCIRKIENHYNINGEIW